MTRSILLADDSVTIQKVVELTFLEEDFEVVAVGSGDAALERLDEVDPALVIADVHMPGADGYEVCRQVKRSRPELPVLLLVGAFESFDPESVEACGAQGFLKKPFDSQELLRIALELVDGGGEEAEAADAGAVEPVEEPVAAESAAVEAAGEEAVERAEPEPPEAAGPESASGPPVEESIPLEPDPSPAREERTSASPLSEEDVERIARRVVELLADRSVRDVAWEVVPDLAEVVIRERLRELESQVD